MKGKGGVERANGAVGDAAEAPRSGSPEAVAAVAGRAQVLTSRLSQMPLATFASVLASRGATTMRSAQRRSSMCRTGSERPFHSCGGDK